MQTAGRFNPRPPSLTGEPVRHFERPVVSGCFNPRPPSLTGEPAHDLDNCLARMKSGLDGLADVLGVDDKHWTLTISKADTVGGFVKVCVEVAHG